jgi:hypothetical protein
MKTAELTQTQLKTAKILVRKGRTDQREYALEENTTTIGKSGSATIRLKGWFTPKLAAKITRREDNSYYVGALGKVPNVNGHRIVRPARLSPGDIIEVAGVCLEFQYPDET